MKYSIIQSTAGKQTYAIELKRKRHNLGNELCLSTSDESGDEEENTVYSINFAKNSLLQIPS